jgi:GMP reductase
MEKALNYENILLKHGKCIVNSRKECNVSTFIAGKKATTPVFCANMPAVINQDICKMFDDAGWFHVYHRLGGYEDIINYVKRANAENWNYVSISIGIKEEDIDLIPMLSIYRIDAITIDVAFSWQEKIVPIIKYIKTYLPNTCLIVGNGDHPDWIKWLEDLGVDVAKINIGTSKACRTRQYTGFGSTTVTDLEKCANAAKNIKILSDGGITKCATGEPAIGDIAKAIRFGADYVMSGSLFSQCLDSPSIREGYYGNSTPKAKQHSNHVEGAILHIDTNGLTIKEQMKLVEDSLRSSVSYSGGKNLESLRSVDYIII